MSRTRRRQGGMLEVPVDSLPWTRSRKISATSNSISLAKTAADSCLSCGLSARKGSLRKPCMEPVSLLSPYLYTSIYPASNIPGVARVPRISFRDTDSCENLTFSYADCTVNRIRSKGWQDVELSQAAKLRVKIPEWRRLFYSPLPLGSKSLSLAT